VLEFDRDYRPAAMTAIPNGRKCQQGVRIIQQTQGGTGTIGVTNITHGIPDRTAKIFFSAKAAHLPWRAVPGKNAKKF